MLARQFGVGRLIADAFFLARDRFLQISLRQAKLTAAVAPMSDIAGRRMGPYRDSHGEDVEVDADALRIETLSAEGLFFAYRAGRTVSDGVTLTLRRGEITAVTTATAAQRKTLGYDTHHAVSPFAPLARGRDEAFTLETWGPGQQTRITATRESGGGQPGGLERPGLGFAPLRNREYRAGLRKLIEEQTPDVVHAHHPSYSARPTTC